MKGAAKLSSPDAFASDTKSDTKAFLREVTLTRVFDAPRDLVWLAWTESERVARWWGPNGFTVPFCRIDARVGGEVAIHMQWPGNGPVIPMRGTFQEVSPKERLVFESAVSQSDGAEPVLLRVVTTATFADAGEGRTRVTVHQGAQYAAPGMEPALDGMEEGWNQTLDSLGDYLAEQKAHAV